MSDFDTAVQRLTAWLRDFGPTKAKPFVDDVTIVLCAAKETVRQADEIARLTQRLAAAETLLDSRPAYGISKCGHSERFLDWEDHSKPIKCTLCELAYLRDLNDKLYASQTANQAAEARGDKYLEALVHIEHAALMVVRQTESKEVGACRKNGT